MPYALLYHRLPEIAERETRTITLLPGTPACAKLGLPPGPYAFLESVCDEEGCDCRRVMWRVMSGERELATIAWGWESRDFYARWMGDGDPDMLRCLIGPVLKLGSRETELSEGVLRLCTTLLLQDPAYVARVKRHYALFRAAPDPAAARSARNAAAPRDPGSAAEPFVVETFRSELRAGVDIERLNRPSDDLEIERATAKRR
jgi:hypothetical protein